LLIPLRGLAFRDDLVLQQYNHWQPLTENSERIELGQGALVLLGNIKVLDTFVASKFGGITHTNIFLPSVVVTYLLSVLLKASES
jgi:hypothetical protein